MLLMQMILAHGHRDIGMTSITPQNAVFNEIPVPHDDSTCTTMTNCEIHVENFTQYQNNVNRDQGFAR